jgi:hypothetical protein
VADGSSEVSDTLDNVIRFGLSDEERARLGITLSGG